MCVFFVPLTSNLVLITGYAQVPWGMCAFSVEQRRGGRAAGHSPLNSPGRLVPPVLWSSSPPKAPVMTTPEETVQSVVFEFLKRRYLEPYKIIILPEGLSSTFHWVKSLEYMSSRVIFITSPVFFILSFI